MSGGIRVFWGRLAIAAAAVALFELATLRGCIAVNSAQVSPAGSPAGAPTPSDRSRA
jgi:hypothetical protein